MPWNSCGLNCSEKQQSVSLVLFSVLGIGTNTSALTHFDSLPTEKHLAPRIMLTQILWSLPAEWAESHWWESHTTILLSRTTGYNRQLFARLRDNMYLQPHLIKVGQGCQPCQKNTIWESLSGLMVLNCSFGNTSICRWNTAHKPKAF